MLIGSKLPPRLSRVLGHLRTKFQRLYHVFEVARFNNIVANTTGNCVIPEIDMAAAQTGRNTISTRRTARNKMSTAMSMFSRSCCSTVLSTMSPEVAGMIYSAPTRPYTHVHTFCERVLSLRLLRSLTMSLNSSTSKTWIRPSLEFCF